MADRADIWISVVLGVGATLYGVGLIRLLAAQ